MFSKFCDARVWSRRIPTTPNKGPQLHQPLVPLLPADPQTRFVQPNGGPRQATMFLLGHSCWSYLLSKATGQKLGVNLPLYLALLAGILPDFDIYFQPFIEHHTYTHSLLVLAPASILLTVYYKRPGAALSIGLLSHLLTDALVGQVPLFYPLSSYSLHLSLGIPGLGDTVLETGALILTVVYAVINRDYKLFTKPSKEALPIIIPLTSMFTLTLLFAIDIKLPLTQLAFSRNALTAISIGHALEGTALAVGSLQGLRAYTARKPVTMAPTT